MSNHPAIVYIRDKIARLGGIESVGVGKDGAINAIISGGIDRRLREEVLDIGRRAMVPVRVFYRMPDGNVIGEDVGDYYKTITIPGFATATSDAPPEEVAAEPKGALKLKRIRKNSRGRPVVGWKVGDKEIRRGTEIEFKNPASLQWTLGRTLTVKPGAKAVVADLASRRPLVYLTIGGYESVELPVHTLGHIFDLPKKPKNESKEHKQDNKSLGYMAPDIMKLVNAVGFGSLPIGFGRADDLPSEVQSMMYGGKSQDRKARRPAEESKDRECECENCDETEEEFLKAPEDDTDDPSEYQRALLLSKK